MNPYIPERTAPSLNEIQTELIFAPPDWDPVSAETAGFGIVELSEISLFNQSAQMLAGISKPMSKRHHINNAAIFGLVNQLTGCCFGIG